MKNSKIVNIQEHKINKSYYTIGLVIGALRAELENGTVAVEDVYSLLTDSVRSAISDDLALAGGAVR